MTALAAAADVQELASSFSMSFEEGIAVDVVYQGALVVKNAAGFIAPGSSTTGLVAAGVAQETVDNSGGSAGDELCKYRTGIFLFVNDSGTAVVKGDEGADVYIFDDATVTGDATGASVAGKCVSFDHDGGGLVAVAIGYPIG